MTKDTLHDLLPFFCYFKISISCSVSPSYRRAFTGILAVNSIMECSFVILTYAAPKTPLQ